MKNEEKDRLINCKPLDVIGKRNSAIFQQTA
jgi:hypothetical protein